MSEPVATAAFRPQRKDVLVSVAADGRDFASLPLPLSTAAKLHAELGVALALAGRSTAENNMLGAQRSAVLDARKSNRTEAARDLLTDIEAWCARTGTPESSIGHKLFLHPGFVGLLRKRLTLSVEKEIAVTEFLRRNPDGWRGDLPQTHGNGTRPIYRSASPRLRHVAEPISADRQACPRCGSRSDVGCRHQARPA